MDSFDGAGKTNFSKTQEIVKLLKRLEWAEKTIFEIESQRDEALRMLRKVRARMHQNHTPTISRVTDVDIPTHSLTQQLKVNPSSYDWILGNWRMCGGSLTDIERLCAGRSWQQALAQLDYRLNHEISGVDDSINYRLLKARILKESGMLPLAITCCEEAIALAVRHGQNEMRGKSQFYLGLMLYDSGRLFDACIAFATASFTEGFQEEAEVWRHFTVQSIQKSNDRGGIDKGDE